MEKPEVDFIEGLSPAIAIEQRGSGTNPRSIIATTTEIYDYLRLLFAHVGQAHCPVSGEPITQQTTSDIVDKILALPPKTRVMLLARVVSEQKGEFRDVIERLAAKVLCARAWTGNWWSWATTSASNWIPNSGTPSRPWWTVWLSMTKSGCA